MGKTGLNFKLYAGAAGTAAASLTEVTIARDVTVNHSAGTADMSTRGKKYRVQDVTLNELTIDFELLYEEGDAQYELIRDAYHAQDPIALAALSGPVATTGSEGPYGDFKITNFSRSEPLEDGATISVTAVLYDFDGDDPWHETSGA